MSRNLPTPIASDQQPSEVKLNKESTRIIWLDGNVKHWQNSCSTKTRLLEINPAAQLHSDLTKCVTIIESTDDEQILLVVSGPFAPQLLPQVHNLRLIAMVFILCEDCSSCPELLEEYPKIDTIFTDSNLLLRVIEDKLDVLEKQLVAFSFFDQKQKSTQDLSKESTLFIWHQLLIDTLHKMPHDAKAKDDMLELCSNFYATNKKELKEIEDFRKSKEPIKAIPWYTKECFLYKLLNRAIRTEDMELVYSFRFYLTDLCDQLKKESEKRKNDTPWILYRGQ